MLSVIFWLIPICSIVANGVTLAYALGNYMSKNRQNYTVGIRLPWTLSSEDNWNKTHRLASKIWVAAGILMLINIFLQIDALLMGVIALSAVIPAVYSFILYKKES